MDDNEVLDRATFARKAFEEGDVMSSMLVHRSKILPVQEGHGITKWNELTKEVVYSCLEGTTFSLALVCAIVGGGYDNRAVVIITAAALLAVLFTL